MADTRRPWDRGVEPRRLERDGSNAGAAGPNINGSAAPDATKPRASRRGLLRGLAVTMGAMTTGALTARGASGRTTDTTARPVFPHAFHGVSVVVPDLDRAIRFYERVLGATVLAARTEIAPGSVVARRLAALTGARTGRGAVACLSLANGVGLELFETPEMERDGMVRPAPLHLAVTDPDVNAFVAEVELLGGTRLGPTLEVTNGAGHRRAFVRDPNGITLEVVSVSFDQALANLS